MTRLTTTDATLTVGMTFPRALRSEALRLRRTPLVPLHLACALAAGAACGLYFAFAPWDPAMGFDAFVQLLGSSMPLMVGIVCGLDVDAEADATCLTGLLSVPSRGRALASRLLALWLMGAAALMTAVCVFALPLAVVGRQELEPVACAAAIAGLACGSAPLYLLLYAVALRWGRNTSIVAGAAGLMLALFSVGGLAHGLMTGELTSSSLNVLSWLPTSWATLLGSLPVELAIATGSGGLAAASDRIASSLGLVLGMCVAGTTLLAGALGRWFIRFEPVAHGE